MRLFYISLLCGAIVHATSSLNFLADQSWSGVVTGQPFEFTWKGNDGDVAITLMNGTVAKPNVVNPIETNVSSNSYSWTPGTFAVPGKKFFIMLEDSSRAKAYGDQFVVAATASTTTSATTSSTAKPKSTSSKTATTTSSTASSSATLSPGKTQESKDKAEENKRLAMGLGITFGFLACGGVCIILIGLIGKRKKKQKEAGVGGGDIGAGGTDGTSDPRLTEKRRFLGFWGRKGGEKGYTSVAQVHELQAHGSPWVQELDGTMRHELQ